MTQTLKYIEVLNKGYSGFAPITLDTDFERSYKQLEEVLQMLDGLDYDALLVEAVSPEGKAYLEKYTSTDENFRYGLHFMRDREIILKSIPTMYKAFKDGADKYRADGVWADEQWREYRWALSEIERGLDERLKQFAVAYKQNPQEVQLPSTLNTEKTRKVFVSALNKGWMQPNNKGGYDWLGFDGKAVWSKLGYMVAKMYGANYNAYGNQGNNIPYRDLEKLFGVSRLERTAQRVFEAKNPQVWRDVINELIETALSTSN